MLSGESLESESCDHVCMIFIGAFVGEAPPAQTGNEDTACQTDDTLTGINKTPLPVCQ